MHIDMHLRADDLIDNPDAQDQTIQTLLSGPNFPVAAGKNIKAITAGVRKAC
jgi:hypothetical protein